MPTVPVLDENQVAPTPIAGQSRQAADFGAAGEAIGNAVANFGRQASGAVDAADHIDAIYDEAGAKRSIGQYGAASTQTLYGQGGYLSQQGINALNAKGDTVQALSDARDELVAQATNPRMKRMIADGVGALYSNDIATITKHATTQGIQWGVAESQGLQQQRVNDAITNADDAKLFAVNVGAALHEIDAQAQLQGTPPAIVAVQKENPTSVIHVSVADAKAGMGNPEGAQQWADDAFHRGEMTGADYLKVSSSLYHPLLDHTATANATNLLAAANAETGAPGTFDANQFFKTFVLPHEGGYAAHDANGAPVNYGINQSANPDVDVRTLTKDQAGDIFAKKYAVKAQGMPAALGGVYADTAYINPARADQFLRESGGDPTKFLALRTAWQSNLVATDPDKYGKYAKAWTNRNNDLGAYIANAGGGNGDGGGNVDLDAVHAKIMTNPAWSQDLKEATWQKVKSQLSDIDQADKRVQSDANDAANRTIEALGPGNFTSTDLIGRDIWRHLSADRQIAFQNQAAANAVPTPVAANGDTAIALSLMAIRNPQAFAQIDIRDYRGKLTPAEFADNVTRQAKQIADPDDPMVVSYAKVYSTIRRFAPDLGLDLESKNGVPHDKQARANAGTIADGMRQDLNALTQGKRAPTDAEVEAAFDRQVLTVRVQQPGRLWGSTTVEEPRYKVPAGQGFNISVPNDVAARIRSSYARQGINPSQATIVKTYISNKGKPGFWN